MGKCSVCSKRLSNVDAEREKNNSNKLCAKCRKSVNN